MKTIILESGERIIAVVPEFCTGPGWTNAVVWVYITMASGKMRVECIQPEERSAEMHALFNPGEVMARALLAAVPVSRE